VTFLLIIYQLPLANHLIFSLDLIYISQPILLKLLIIKAVGGAICCFLYAFASQLFFFIKKKRVLVKRN